VLLLALLGVLGFVFRKYLVFVLKSLRRNLLRTSLTSVVIIFFVFQTTLILSVLAFLDRVMTEQSKDFKAIVSEKWQIPSQMPITYSEPLSRAAATTAQDVRPQDSMTWSFYGGSTEKDRDKRSIDNMIFFFCMDPSKLRTMMEDLENLDQNEVDKLLDNDRAVLIGRERLQKINKRIGDTITVYSMNYKDIDLRFDIVGTFPDGRYNQSAVMNWKYLQRKLDEYKRENKQPHPMADKSLNLVWLRVPDSKAFGRVAQQIETSVEFKNKPVKCETMSSGVSTFLDAYKDLIKGMRWLLCPAMLFVMALVVACSISISVRERRTEMAVLKVLGFRPAQIMALILGEALLIGVVSGLLSAAGTYVAFLGGIKFPIAFFPVFVVPVDALWWGFAIGIITGLAGSIIPAWSARSVKVSEVFAKIT
jgi:putative ABC transport system permease protein